MFSIWEWQKWIGSALVIGVDLRIAFKMGQYEMIERLDSLPRDHTRRDRAAAWERLRKIGRGR
jgi:hypothetical protein